MERPGSQGQTKEAAISLTSFLAQVPNDEPSSYQRSIGKAMGRRDVLCSAFYNDPPTSHPLIHREFFSLDTTSVEIWLRRVFGGYRSFLPPVTASIQQHYQCWLRERWRDRDTVATKLVRQVEEAEQTHDLIEQYIAQQMGAAKTIQQQQDAYAQRSLSGGVNEY